MEKYVEIERSIIKKYRKPIWSRFTSAIRDYKLIEAGDKIAVCISGGKDSMLMAMCMQHLKKYSKIPFDVEYIVMDPGYNEVNRQRIVDNAKLMNIPVDIFETQIFDVVELSGGAPCYLCARMRRGYLYRHAQKLGCNKIALGHHFDDMIETVLMSMLYAGEIKTMMPKLHSSNFEGMELIRPMYMVHEEDILAWTRYNELHFIQCACKITESIEKNNGGSKRHEMKMLVKQLKKINSNFDLNIFTSLHNVNLDTIVGYRENGKRHTFLEYYDYLEVENDLK
nr:ATP-binding protein [Sedimentibacter sp.]